MKGPYVMDYSTLDSQGKDNSTAAQVKKRCKLHRQALRSIKARLAERELSSVMRFPPLDQPTNVVDSLLAAQHAPRWMQVFAEAVPHGAVASVVMLHAPEFWDFQRAHTTLHLQLSYE